MNAQMLLQISITFVLVIAVWGLTTVGKDIHEKVFGYSSENSPMTDRQKSAVGMGIFLVLFPLLLLIIVMIVKLFSI
jgi:hypothetical protein